MAQKLEQILIGKDGNGNPVFLTEENYATRANNTMRKRAQELKKLQDLKKAQNLNERKDRERLQELEDLSTSKLRGIYALIVNISIKIDDEDSFEGNKGELQYLKVKMAYECGRNKGVHSFIDETYLMRLIDNIKTYGQFLLYYRYAESLVAYFKYYGGKD